MSRLRYKLKKRKETFLTFFRLYLWKLCETMVFFGRHIKVLAQRLRLSPKNMWRLKQKFFIICNWKFSAVSNVQLVCIDFQKTPHFVKFFLKIWNFLKKIFCTCYQNDGSKEGWKVYLQKLFYHDGLRISIWKFF